MNYGDADYGQFARDRRIRVDKDDAAVVIVNTCAIRENAEAKVFIKSLLSCAQQAAEPPWRLPGTFRRLRTQHIEGGHVDAVVGPGWYRQLPAMLTAAQPRKRITCCHSHAAVARRNMLREAAAVAQGRACVACHTSGSAVKEVSARHRALKLSARQ